jgi:hypothetical protein
VRARESACSKTLSLCTPVRLIELKEEIGQKPPDHTNTGSVRRHAHENAYPHATRRSAPTANHAHTTRVLHMILTISTGSRDHHRAAGHR